MTTGIAVTPRPAGRARPSGTRPTAESATLAGERWMLGDWLVHPATLRLERGGTEVALEPRMMAVLAELCRHPGEVLSAEQLLQACWPGESVGDNPVHKVIAGLRRALGDSVTAPRYLETLRKQGYRLIAPLRALSDQGPRGLLGSRRGQSPFCGLAAFDADQADVFFGRDAEVRALHERLDAQWRAGHAQVVLLGPSGSGKTSLVQAGLLPALLQPAEARPGGDDLLRSATTTTLDLGSLGEADLWAGLAGALLDWELQDTALLSGWSIDTLASALRDRPAEVAEQVRLALQAAVPPGSPPAPAPVLVLDRLEALLVREDESEVDRFLAGVDRLVSQRAVLLVAICRNDFYARLARHPSLLRGKAHGAHMDLEPPSAAAVAQMIRLPARAAGLVFGRDASGLNRLDDRLCAEALQTPDALPLLQYTLQELYLQREPGDELSWAAYEAMGGLEGAISRRAEAALAALPPPQQAALTRLLPRLVGLATEDAPPTGRWLAESELADDDERALVQALVQSRLLVAGQAHGQPGCRVVHEAVLRRWPRVTSWLAQHRAGLALREQLQPWVQRWLEGSQADALLLPRSALLWQAVSAIAASPALFGAEACRFVARSQARLRRLTRWRWGASAAVLLLALATVVSGVRSLQLAHIASERANQSQRLASFMLGDLADQLRPMGRLDLLGSLGAQGLQALGVARGAQESPLDALQRARALVVIAEVEGTRGKGRTELALSALDQADALLGGMEGGQGLDRGSYFKTLGAAAFWRGQIRFDQGDLAGAAVAMGRYRDACERWLRAAPTDATARTELGFALNSLGAISLRRADWAAAAQAFEAALALKQALLAEQPQEVELQDAVASSRTWLGLLARLRGQPEAALAHLDAAAAAQQALHRARPGEFVRLHDLGALQVRRAEALWDLGSGRAAAQAMDEALTWLSQAAAHDPGNRRWRLEQAHAEAGRWVLRLELGQPLDAAVLARLMQQLRAEDGQPDAELRQETQARLLTAQALDARRRGDVAGAHAVLAQARDSLQPLLERRPLHWQLQEAQARLVLLRLGLPVPSDLGAAAAQAECARDAAALQAIVDTGQAGLVRQAWQAATQCAGAAPPEPSRPTSP